VKWGINRVVANFPQNALAKDWFSFGEDMDKSLVARFLSSLTVHYIDK